jgi:hypothetical protein
MTTPSVTDAFLFSNDLDMLELRLEILDAVVDRFVLVESTVTFSGQPKPLHFAEHRGRFDAWSDRITHVVVDDTPDSGHDRWARERHQRDQLQRGLPVGRGDDVVLISDVDEIPDPDKVAERRLGRYEQLDLQCHLNCVQDEEPHYGTAARLWFEVAALGAQRARERRFSLPVVTHGGWHFSSVLPPEQIHEKLAAFSHAEYDTPEHHAAIDRRRRELTDLFANRATPLRVMALDDPALPEVLRRPDHRWDHMLLDPGDAASPSGSSLGTPRPRPSD